MLPDLQVNGRPIWSSEDLVHGVLELYRLAAVAIASTIANEVEGDEDGGQPPQKRQRLESVVVRRAGENIQRGRGATASWSTGTLPPPHGKGTKGRGRPMRGRIMRGSWRGGRWPPRSHRGGLF
jgi:hypothetical protein